MTNAQKFILALFVLSAIAWGQSNANGGGNSQGGGGPFPQSVTGAVTSGGIPCFTSATIEASSGALGANLPVIGGGAGVCPSSGTVTGNTTKFLTGSGAYTNGHGLVIDANGNVNDSGSAPAGGTGNAAAPVTTPVFTLTSGTYTSGGTITGTTGQTCTLSAFNGGGAGATATVALTGTNVIAGGTALTITAAGSGFTSAPTSATLGNGTATCSGTATLSTSTNPTYTCPSATAGTVVDFLPSSTLIANIPGSSLATCTTGSLLNFRFVQDATGGRTVVMPTGFESCFANPAANIGTKCTYFWDGTNARLVSNTGDAGFAAGQTVAAPGSNPPAADCFSWFDSADNRYHDRCNGTSTNGTTVVAFTPGTNQLLSGISTAGVISGTFPAGQVNAQTTAYTAVAADYGKLITMNGVSLTLTLPAAPPSAGWYTWIEDLAATDLTIARNGLTINGTTNNLTITQFQLVKIWTDNTNYFATANAAETFTKTLGVGTGPPSVTAGNGGGFGDAEGTAPTGLANVDICYGDSTAHALKCSYNNGTFFNMPQVIASGTATMTTAAIAAGACGTTVTVAATGVATTDSIIPAFNAAPAGTNAGLTWWVTANNVNFAYCPGVAETPVAATVNWRVIR